MPKTNFAAWSQTNLANFCADAENKLAAQKDRIEQLTEERDVAIKAYRSLLAKPLQAADADFSAYSATGAPLAQNNAKSLLGVG